MLLRRRHRQAESVEVSAPAGSAKKAEWYAYAVHVGVSAEDLEGLTRDQIKEAAEAMAGADETATASGLFPGETGSVTFTSEDGAIVAAALAEDGSFSVDLPTESTE